MREIKSEIEKLEDECNLSDKINKLIKEYKIAKSAMSLSSVASCFYHLEVDIKFLIGLIKLIKGDK